LETRIERVASRLLLLVAARAEPEAILEAAKRLAMHEKRRVLLLLAIWVVRDRNPAAAERIARMLPRNHVGVKWALGGAKGKLGDDALDDLGDPICVEQVLMFMRPQPKKRR
jgi:hypothetical protein